MKTAIILVEPQMGENIGSCARAMKNFALEDLRIVNPRDGWPNPRAYDLSVGAFDIIENAKIFGNLEDAISDLNYLFAVTARERDMNKSFIYTNKVNDYLQDLPKQNIGFLFGKESSGLTNKDVSYADAIISIETNPLFKSLNLAQAVTIISYELFNYYSASSGVSNKKSTALVNKEHLNYFINMLISELDKKSFFQVEEKRYLVTENIRNIFTRNSLSKDEVQILISMLLVLSNPE